MSANASNPPRPLTVVVAGSVAAIKAPLALRRLREAGFAPQVILTRAAAAFTTAPALAQASASAVATDETWFAAQPGAQHLTLARVPVLVLGATADLLGQAAHGLAGSLAAATVLSAEAGVVWAPAMNARMWEHPAVQANVARLRDWGHHFLGPVSGAFGTPGEGAGLGRMLEPEAIAAQLPALLGGRAQDLAGLRVLVSAGPTREYLDPVRFLSNPSSGKMGYAVARAAHERGASVTLVSGPVNLAAPQGVEVIPVESALQMHAAVLGAASEADIVVMTAAVSDYRAATVSDQKAAKTGAALRVDLVPNPDILAELGARKGERVHVGFAMETHAGVERAADKARRKNADFILLNYPAREGTGFGGDFNEVTLVRPDGGHDPWPRLSKREVADRLLDEALRVRQGGR